MNLCHQEIVEVQKVYDAGTGTLVSARIQGAGCWCQVHLQVAWRMRNPSKGLRGFKRCNVGPRGVKSRSLPVSSPQCELLGLLFSTEQTARHLLLGVLRDLEGPLSSVPVCSWGRRHLHPSGQALVSTVATFWSHSWDDTLAILGGCRWSPVPATHEDTGHLWRNALSTASSSHFRYGDSLKFQPLT